MHACYLNELPNAAVLATSFLGFHPNASFVALIVDGVAGQAALPNAKILSLADLGLDAGEEWRLPMLLSHRELRAYLEPLLIELLARTYDDPVAYFPPSTKIFGTLSHVFDRLQPASAILATEPVQNEWGDRGRSFIGVPSGSDALLRQWVQRSRDAGTAGESSSEGLAIWHARDDCEIAICQSRERGNYCSIDDGAYSGARNRFFCADLL